MGSLSYVLALLLVAAGLVFASASHDRQDADDFAADRRGRMLVVYARAAAAYAQAHPTTSGSVSRSQLAPPSWLGTVDGLSAYVANGRGYAYLTYASEGEAFAVAGATGPEAQAGVKRGSVLVPAGNNVLATSWPAPGAIPDRSAVVFF